MSGDVVWQPQALREVAGDWVAGIADWRWYGTLTFKDYVSESYARRALKAWSRDVAAKEIHRHFSLAYTVERTKGAGIWHHHVLLGVPTPSDAMVLNAARVQWRRSSESAAIRSRRARSFSPEDAKARPPRTKAGRARERGVQAA